MRSDTSSIKQEQVQLPKLHHFYLKMTLNDEEHSQTSKVIFLRTHSEDLPGGRNVHQDKALEIQRLRGGFCLLLLIC